ncbi:MAG TPA: hypothetical protein VN222_12885 [Novosphingobium sp.]|nr:hypothetical protein [Novosphingobium sp.]
MHETFDQWQFVALAYAIGGGATLALVAWSWLSMRRAEARRDTILNKGREG